MNSIIENNQDLTVAVKNGDISAVKTFLKNGVDVNATSGRSTTLLYWACLEGHTNIVKLLLDNGAETEKGHLLGNSALIVASEKGYTDIVKLLLDSGADVNRQGFMQKTH